MWTLSGFADEISPDLEVQCRVLGELGIGYVEFRSAWRTNVLDLDDEQLVAVAGMLSRYGLKTSSIGSPIGKIAVTDDFDAHVRRFDRALQVAKILSAPFIRIFSFFVPQSDLPRGASRDAPDEMSGGPSAAHRDEVMRRLSVLAERAKGFDVVLVHENEKEIYGDIPSRCLDIVESIGSETLRLAWDPANFVQCGVRPYTDAYAMLRPYVDYVQVKDASLADGTVVPAGRGDGEVAATVAALRADGFDGFFSMEPHLSAAGPFGGFSGPELFGVATHAFVAILDNQGVRYR